MTAGNIDCKELSDVIKEYNLNMQSGNLEDTGKTTKLINTFYNLVTDIYEWGWGESFHFSPSVFNFDNRLCEVVHEARAAALIDLQPGMKALDVGCGVGGPMRRVAAFSGGEVVGITINDYQVERGTYHNKRDKIDHLCSVVQGNFMEMPFPDNSFDCAYAIEATCHADDLKKVYREVFRVLKPGGRFLTYEWLKTDLYDANNKEHVDIIDGINYTNGLPNMRTIAEAENAAKTVGFNIIRSVDADVCPEVNRPWYKRLDTMGPIITVNASLVAVMKLFGAVPSGVQSAHDLLVSAAYHLVRGGKTGVFTPQHMILM